MHQMTIMNWSARILACMPARTWALAAFAAVVGISDVHAGQDNARGSGAVAPSAAVDRSLVDKYCVTCHGQRLKTAGLLLDRVDLTQVQANAEVLEKVVRKLRSGQMPPAKARRPDEATLHAFVTALEAALDNAAAAAPDPGRVTVRRLNRLEYINAIADLLSLDVDQALLPPDVPGTGFDNNSESLSVTPALMNRYLSAARKVTLLALGDPAMRPATSVYKAPPHVEQIVRMSEDHPFGTHGGLSIRHNFPLDGEYVFRVRLQRNLNADGIRGIDDRADVQVRIDRQLVKRFAVGGKHRGFDPANSAIPEDDIEGRRRHTYQLTADDHMEFRIPVHAGARLVTASFTDLDPRIPDRLPMIPATLKSRDRGDDTEPGVDTIQIVGPYAATAPKDTASRGKILVCRPMESAGVEPCAERIIGALARRAYRRPVDDTDIRELMRLFRDGYQENGFEAGIGLALEAIVSSPAFLFRIERDPVGASPGTVYRISDLELASRLSFALWKSVPDDELLEVAIQGRLHEPSVQRKQVRRMLADPKASRWINDFVEQWLGVRSLEAHEPDPLIFPEFTDSLRRAMLTETKFFFESQVRNDASVLDLLRADYTYLNAELARHYGVSDVYGSHFRRVAVTDPVRQGLLGHGSILTATSYANRTSVVVRGHWVLDTLLGAPPPPPPPPANVPALPENKPGAAPQTLRARMEQHRKNPVCASCHAPMDPLGFALENFDATGQWRDTEDGMPIDAVSQAVTGEVIDGPLGFREHLLGRRDEFVRTLAARLLEYFLGRSLQYYDYPTVRAVIGNAAPDYRWSSLIMGIVESVPFQMRKVVGPESVSARDTVADRR